MDVNELLNFKPVTAPKRPAPMQVEEEHEEFEDNPDDSYELRAAKRRKARKAAQRRQEEEEKRLAEIRRPQQPPEAAEAATPAKKDVLPILPDVNDDDDEQRLTDASLKKSILNFEKRALKNQELRIKFPEQPEKFMESEVDLHDAIQDLRAVATAPELFPILVDLRCISSLLGLLSHENSDISVAVVDLLQELTDVDTLNESEEGAEALIRALSENQVTPLLVQNLERLKDNVREESDGIHNTLSVIENLIEFRPETCKEAANAGLLVWLVKRLKVRVEFDTNKLYASEILSILLQNEPDNRVTFGEMPSAIDSLLQQLAFYKRHNPHTPEENELLENLFDCLCCLLMHGPNRDRFLKGEGLQLMNLMLREKRLSRNGALKVLSHGLNGPEGKESCNKLVDILGLRTVFPLFMKTPKKGKRKGVTTDEFEERTISVVASLVRNCRGSQRTRLLAKFTENDHEKVERLLELHFKYLNKVDDTERELDPEEDEDEAYIKRLEGGLFSLQLVDYIILEVCSSGPSSIKARVLQILNQRNASSKTIRNVVREYAGNIGDNRSTSEKEEEQQHLLSLVHKF